MYWRTEKVTAWQMIIASIRDFSFFHVILDHVLLVRYYGIVIIDNARNYLITYFIIGKKSMIQTINVQHCFLINVLYQMRHLVSLQCWDIWLKECKEELNKTDFSDNNSDKKKIKLNIKMLSKKIKRFGG